MNNIEEITSFTILIERKLTKTTSPASFLKDGVDQPIKLPAPIFLLSDYTSDYRNAIDPVLAEQGGNISVKSVTKSANGQNLIITYQNAADTINETITIALDGRDYVGTLNWTRNAFMRLKEPLIRVDDAAQADQFNQIYYMLKRSGFTMVQSDFFKPRDFEADTLPNDKIRKAWGVKMKIDNEKGIMPMVIAYQGAAVLNVSWVTGLTLYTDYIGDGSAGIKK